MPDERTAPLVAALRAAGCVFAEDEAAVLLESAGDDDELDLLLARRVTGEPLEHVVGWATFGGLRVHVAPGVFVPRPRTEALVDLAVGLVGPGATVLDLCCGSGALGLAVAVRVSGVRLHVSDLDPAAVAVAARNVEPVGGSAHLGDLFTPLPPALRGGVDLVIANVPYVPSDEIRLLPREAREHEPALALDGGVDGLAVLRRVAGEVAAWLAPGGHLVTESYADQAAAVVAALAAGGLDARSQEAPDDEETALVVARKPGGSATSEVAGDGTGRVGGGS